MFSQTDLQPLKVSVKLIYKTCQFLLPTEQKSIKIDKFSTINNETTILYREGRLVDDDVHTGLIANQPSMMDDTFGNEVSLHGFVIFI